MYSGSSAFISRHYSTHESQGSGILNTRKRVILFLLVDAAIVAAIVSVTYVEGLGRSGNNGGLPPGCVGPSGGFLIVTSSLGYNDSVSHGAPVKPWPVIHVQKGATVNIVVCNTDRQAHGFQIAHYYDQSIETVAPGQVIKLSFTADESGTFEIYCSILCAIHTYMQNGQLQVG